MLWILKVDLSFNYHLIKTGHKIQWFKNLPSNAKDTG